MATAATNARVPPARAEPAGPWTFTVPDYLPPSLNELVGCGVGKRTRLKRECADLLAVYAREAGVPKVRPGGYAPRRRVRVKVTGWRRGKVPDADNMLKALLDGLKTAGLIVDDAAAWCEWERPELVRSPARSTAVTLEDIP